MIANKKILIAGGEGLLGSNLYYYFLFCLETEYFDCAQYKIHKRSAEADKTQRIACALFETTSVLGQGKQ